MLSTQFCGLPVDYTYMHVPHFGMSLINTTLITSGFLLNFLDSTFDFSREYSIFFYVLAVVNKHELPTKTYIDPPQYIKADMLAGFATTVAL